MVARVKAKAEVEAVGELPPPLTNVYFGSKEIEFIRTGCTLLDCVVGGGWPLGRIVNIVGDKSTGKCANDYFYLTQDGLHYSEDTAPSMPMGASRINWTMPFNTAID